MQVVTARLVGLYLDLALRTTRWTLVGEEHAAAATAGQANIAAFWHERLPLLPALWFIMRRRGARGTPRVLVSKHRDGRFIGAVVRRFGVAVVTRLLLQGRLGARRVGERRRRQRARAAGRVAGGASTS